MAETNFKTIKSSQFWLSLDNAAKIYPAIINEKATAVFRLTAVMKKAVNIMALMKIIPALEQRFPYYKVRMKKGLFWYYLEHHHTSFPVIADDRNPCRKFPAKGSLLRILVRDNQLSVEFSHILSDGSGAFEFLKTLLVLYLKAQGHEIPANFSYHIPGENIPEEEYEDSYKRYFKENVPPMLKKSEAFHLPFSRNQPHRFSVSHVIIPVESLKKKASESGVSITNYLVSVYLYLLQDIFENMNSFSRRRNSKSLRVQVPVNLRNILASGTMRNFSLFVLPEIDLRLGHYTFDEIIKTVYHQMKLETDEKLLNKNIARNVGSERKIYVKSIPLFIKSFILKLKYNSLGTSQYSGVITNLGRTNFPGVIHNSIDHFIFTPPPPNRILKINCGIISHGDTLVISFGNITRSKELEIKFVRFLNDRGIRANFKKYRNEKL